MRDNPVSRMGHSPGFITPPSAPPIYQTTAFDIPDLQTLQQVHTGDVQGYVYTRDSNPNHAALAGTLAGLEHAPAGAVFSSGMGAIAALLISLAATGDHIVVSRLLYGRSIQLVRRLAEQFRIEVSEIDVADHGQLRSAVREDTKLCLVESISNPLLDVVDVAAAAEILGEVPLIVDSTFTTPELIRPLDLGAHAVVHSASKYLNGHGDVTLGVAAGTQELMASAGETASLFGQNANPFESWLTQRGLRTLPLRMQQICCTTRALAEFLHRQPGIRRVHYPLLESHPSFELARLLYPEGSGGIISIELADVGTAAVSRFMQAVPQFPFSPTLADIRTTLSHPASTSHRYMTAEDRTAIGISDELIRISVGLEPLELLQEEFTTALRGVTSV